MNSCPIVRWLVWTSICLALWLAAPLSFGADPPRVVAQAQVLDHAEFLCANCLFGPSDYYYCLATGSQVLIGYQKTPVLNWEDKSKNYLTGAHPRWTAWLSPDHSVPISYDDKHIWINREDLHPERHGFWGHIKGMAIWASRGDSKEVRLTRSSMSDIFLNNEQCRNAGGPKTQ